MVDAGPEPTYEEKLRVSPWGLFARLVEFNVLYLRS